MTQTASMQRPSGRSFLLDLFKATGCVLIVLHHLAFYGPMADVAAPVWPEGKDWLAQHARLVVQMFLVCSGFLTAQSLNAMPSLSWQALGLATRRRYFRLATPLLAALSLTVIVSEVIRPHFMHSSLSAPPDWAQAFAHVFFVQHLLDFEALSAGVWYVAVDLQLFVLALLVLRFSGLLQQRVGGSVLGWQVASTLILVVLSLIVWTHDDALDDSALYFWGAYGMGWMAWHTRQLPNVAWSRIWWLILGVLCFAVDTRFRALTAWTTAVLLVLAPTGCFLDAADRQVDRTSAWRRGISWLSQISYAVFVVHFGVCLGVNFAIHRLWPDSVPANALGMAVALGMSLLVGHAVHHVTERGAMTWTRWMVWMGCFMASVWLAIRLAV